MTRFQSAWLHFGRWVPRAFAIFHKAFIFVWGYNVLVNKFLLIEYDNVCLRSSTPSLSKPFLSWQIATHISFLNFSCSTLSEKQQSHHVHRKNHQTDFSNQFFLRWKATEGEFMVKDIEKAWKISLEIRIRCKRAGAILQLFWSILEALIITSLFDKRLFNCNFLVNGLHQLRHILMPQLLLELTYLFANAGSW